MRALIDSDILCYEFGGMKQLEDPDQPLAWQITRSMVDDRLNQILEAVNATSYSLYLTDSPSNFRISEGSIVPYKGTRATEKPHWWAAIRQHLIDQWGAEVQYGIEADDRLGIEQMKDLATACTLVATAPVNEWHCDEKTILCSRDKDLHMIPGWHYSWACGKQPERLWFQDETNAIRCFYRQLLTGDTTDNILGLYGVGGKSRLVLRLEDFDEELDMFKHVFKAYQDRFGSYACKFMWENGALLWMLREEPTASAYLESSDRLNDLLSEVEDV
jgi:hypothetical protein